MSSRLSVNFPTTQEHLASGCSNLDCLPSLSFCFGFLRVVRTTLEVLVRHFSLELDLLKTNPTSPRIGG